MFSMSAVLVLRCFGKSCRPVRHLGRRVETEDQRPQRVGGFRDLQIEIATTLLALSLLSLINML
jgi:hypothetical protein